MWQSQIDGPVLVRFDSFETNEQDTEHLSTYIDIRSILAVEQRKEGGSTVVLAGGVHCDLHDGAVDVLRRIAKAAKEMGGDPRKY